MELMQHVRTRIDAVMCAVVTKETDLVAKASGAAHPVLMIAATHALIAKIMHAILDDGRISLARGGATVVERYVSNSLAEKGLRKTA